MYHTYISENKSKDEEFLMILQADYNIVITNTVSAKAINLRTISTLTGEFGRSRIAAPPSFYMTPHNIKDYMIVIDYYYADGQTGTWEILGYNKYNNLPLNDILLNDGLQSRSNTDPVVTYSGDIINISWTSYLYNSGALANEVVSRQLYNFGTIMASNTISVVNNFTQEYQYLSSIAGRFSDANLNLHLYLNESMNEIQYKTATNTDVILRKNPYYNSTAINIKNSNNVLEIETAIENYNIIIYNTIGQILYKESSLSESQKVSISNLPNGVYIINIKSAKEEQSYKFIKN
jgi:hypothetical protein